MFWYPVGDDVKVETDNRGGNSGTGNRAKMENAKTLFKIDVIRPVNLPFIQEEMTLR